MAQDSIRYPINTQTFSKIREDNYFYVDKTEYVYNMTHSDMTYVFLSRPRRFGKSVLVSTLKSYFEGKKELFKGLAIEKLESKWEEYPVLHFDMSGGKHMSEEKLDEYLKYLLDRNERSFDLPLTKGTANIRLTNLIETLSRKYGKGVVVLIDEYDAPLLDVVHEDENLPKLRNVMRNFYSPLKACDPYLRFVFITGITKFSQLSIFSELNNIANISMENEYAAICGISEEEMLSKMTAGLDKIAKNMDITRKEAVERVKAMYDGYHFTWPSPDVYNPYSLVNAFSRGRLDSFWFGSGTPTYLIEMLRKFKVEPDKIGGRKVDVSAFDAPTERMNNITPLLYQSGYVTITDYDEGSELYTLDIPNREVRTGLMKNLVQFYVPLGKANDAITFGAEFYNAIRKGEIDNSTHTISDWIIK